jgi:hypothetical protein
VRLKCCAANDTLTANGATVLLGGSGSDTFVLDAAMISALQTSGLSSGVYARVDGGSGTAFTDTIKVSNDLNLTSIANQGKDAIGFSRLESIEIIDLSASGDQILTLTSKDVIDMSGSNVFATWKLRHGVCAAGDERCLMGVWLPVILLITSTLIVMISSD